MGSIYIAAWSIGNALYAMHLQICTMLNRLAWEETEAKSSMKECRQWPYAERITSKRTKLGKKALMKNITFMDSSGVGLIMGRYRLMQRLGGTVEVIGVAPKIRTMLRLAGIDRLGIMKGEQTDESNQ